MKLLILLALMLSCSKSKHSKQSKSLSVHSAEKAAALDELKQAYKNDLENLDLDDLPEANDTGVE